MPANPSPLLLVVDDEKDIRQSFRYFLEDNDYRVLEAENGRVGLETIKAMRPDLVLLDLSMPEVGGLEVLGTLTSISPDTPVIVASGTGLISDVVEALHLGAWDYINKPIDDLTVLLHAVKKCLERAQLRKDNRMYQMHLEARTAELELLSDNIDTQIWYLADAETYGVVNRAHAAFLGCGKEELEHKKLTEIFGPREAELLIKGNRDVFQRKGKIRSKETIRNGSGEQRLLEIVKTPKLDGNGRVEYVVCSGEDITRRSRWEKVLRESEKKFRTFTESSPAAVFILKGARFLYANPAAEEMTGYKEKELREIEVHDLVHPHFKSVIEERGKGWLEKVADSKERVVAKMQSRSGASIWVDSRAERIDYKEQSAVLVSAIDITELRSALEALKKSKERAESANAAKSEFLANMSHEIRTPMNGVMGMTALLLDTPLSQEQREYADMAKKSADSLLTIINDILDFSKVEARKLELETLDFDLRTTLDNLNDILGMRAKEKNIRLLYHTEPTVPSLLRGDPGRLRQVLTNLLGNAVKFTAKGEVSLHVNVAGYGEDNCVFLRFTVKDTGIGIPAKKIKHLFQAFSQADGSTTRKYGGTGLGLAISKQLTEMMGGQIGVESNEEKGSTFWFTVKLQKQEKHPFETAPPDEVLRGIRTLAVDGERNLHNLSQAMCSWGCNHEETDDWDAIPALLLRAVKEKKPFKAVVMDTSVSNAKGIELGTRIKEDALLADTHLVLITSGGHRGDASRLEKIGFAAYLTRPVEKRRLHDCLVSVINQEPGLGQIITRHSVEEERKQHSRILLAEDNYINRKLVLRFLEKMGYHADAVVNGREAVNILGSQHYDMVLMDIQMPEMDGFEATKAIREKEESAPPDKDGRKVHLPIIAMTAHALKGDREKCLAGGMDDYISKPIKPAELAKVIARLLADN
ncbi:MAG: response regulator [bacterium]|nr:response regulator [bacterium]